MKDGNKLPIRQFKLSDMVKNPAIIMIAKRGSGKSWVVRAIMHHFRSIPCGIIIAPTDRMNPFYNIFFQIVIYIMLIKQKQFKNYYQDKQKL